MGLLGSQWHRASWGTSPKRSQNEPQLGPLRSYLERRSARAADPLSAERSYTTTMLLGMLCTTSPAGTGGESTTVV